MTANGRTPVLQAKGLTKRYGRVVAIDGRPIRHWSQIDDAVSRAEARPLTMTIERGGQRREVRVTPRRLPAKTPFGEATEVWGLGISPYLAPVVSPAGAR